MMYDIYNNSGELVLCGYETEQEACIVAKEWANEHGEGCTVVSEADPTDCLHDVTPDWTD